MANFKKIVEVLNDLIKINKDREEGYVKASRELTPAEHNLRGVFERKAQESRNNVQQLQYKAQEFTSEAGEEIANDTSISGKLYRVWMDVKSVFTGDNDKSALESCVHGEEAAQQCYAQALDEEELPEDITSLLRQQKQSIDQSKEEIQQELRNISN
ncbi:MAG TPA: PA2169 family four-helix-bundle protein [Chitinophagaceae bacterium]|nr:PA2169 family four-helix-bundle protein [Chitinophagaceae bacterium]